MARRKKPNRVRQVIWAAITAIVVSVSLAAWQNIEKIWAMGEKQESYEEAYVQMVDFTRQQRTANQQVQQQLDYFDQDQQRQWDVLRKTDEWRPRDKAERRAYQKRYRER